MRLIDADALKGMDIKIGHIGEKTVRAIQWATVDALYRNIDKSPTVDAAPVVRGEWEYEHGAWACSKCGEDNPYGIDYETVAFSNYCPNCGANMTGENGTKKQLNL
jgi:predicted RNA-binding Zn-ribbon protein involved in translation (DUF1610 family)